MEKIMVRNRVQKNLKRIMGQVQRKEEKILRTPKILIIKQGQNQNQKENNKSQIKNYHQKKPRQTKNKRKRNKENKNNQINIKYTKKDRMRDLQVTENIQKIEIKVNKEINIIRIKEKMVNKIEVREKSRQEKQKKTKVVIKKINEARIIQEVHKILNKRIKIIHLNSKDQNKKEEGEDHLNQKINKEAILLLKNKDQNKKEEGGDRLIQKINHNLIKIAEIAKVKILVQNLSKKTIENKAVEKMIAIGQIQKTENKDNISQKMNQEMIEGRGTVMVDLSVRSLNKDMTPNKVVKKVVVKDPIQETVNKDNINKETLKEIRRALGDQMEMHQNKIIAESRMNRGNLNIINHNIMLKKQHRWHKLSRREKDLQKDLTAKAKVKIVILKI